MSLKISDLNKEEKQTTEHTGSFLTKDISLFSTKLPEKDKEQIYSSLSTLLNSGIDLNRSLEIVQDELKDKAKKAIFQNVISAIQSGASLSEAMQKETCFSSYEIYTVMIGEEVGRLGTVLKELQEFYKGNIKRNRMVMSALSYPIFVVSIAVIAVVFMMIFVVPMFEEVFKRFNGELPGITKAVISVSETIQNHGVVILFGILLLVVSLVFILKIESVKMQVSKVLIRLPFIGSFVVKSNLSKLSGVMSMLLGAGIHLLRALELSRNVMSFLPFKEALTIMIKDIEEGGSVHHSLTNKTLFPNKFAALIKVGEEVNKLDYFFKKAHQEYNDDLEHATSVLGTVMEPLLIVFLGVIIGVILVSMYLPLFDLSSQF